MRVSCGLLIALCALTLVAAGKKNPAVTIRFYSETNPSNNEVFAAPVQLSHPPRKAWIGKIPEISERDVAAIFPFPAADGTMGCAFKLNTHGTLMLDTMSIEKRGRSVVAIVNGRQVIDLVIDRRVSDGILTIPRGLQPPEISRLQKAFPTMGAGKQKKKTE